MKDTEEIANTLWNGQQEEIGLLYVRSRVILQYRADDNPCKLVAVLTDPEYGFVLTLRVMTQEDDKQTLQM
jgi:hypothetical protein